MTGRGSSGFKWGRNTQAQSRRSCLRTIRRVGCDIAEVTISQLPSPEGGELSSWSDAWGPLDSSNKLKSAWRSLCIPAASKSITTHPSTLVSVFIPATPLEAPGTSSEFTGVWFDSKILSDAVVSGSLVTSAAIWSSPISDGPVADPTLESLVSQRISTESSSNSPGVSDVPSASSGSSSCTLSGSSSGVTGGLGVAPQVCSSSSVPTVMFCSVSCVPLLVWLGSFSTTLQKRESFCFLRNL